LDKSDFIGTYRVVCGDRLDPGIGQANPGIGEELDLMPRMDVYPLGATRRTVRPEALTTR
jgi:hypothetical protein